jgi:hypothetical protein
MLITFGMSQFGGNQKVVFRTGTKTKTNASWFPLQIKCLEELCPICLQIGVAQISVDDFKKIIECKKDVFGPFYVCPDKIDPKAGSAGCIKLLEDARTAWEKGIRADDAKFKKDLLDRFYACVKTKTGKSVKPGQNPVGPDVNEDGDDSNDKK